jgi:hypothetical protein
MQSVLPASGLQKMTQSRLNQIEFDEQHLNQGDFEDFNNRIQDY